jgi:hypothetical protein
MCRAKTLSESLLAVTIWAVLYGEFDAFMSKTRGLNGLVATLLCQRIRMEHGGG